jgi:hypothetical protein
MLAVAPVVAHRVAHRVEHRQLQMALAAAPGRHAADQLGAVGDALLRMKSALLAGEALADHFGALVDEDAHAAFLVAAPADLFGRVRQIGGRDDRQSALRQPLARHLGIGALQSHHHRHRHADVLDGIDDAIGDQVAAHDAAEDVDQDRAHLWIGQDQLKRRGHAIAGRTAADVEKVRRPAAVQLDQVHGRHRRPAPLTMQAILPSSET